MRWRWLAVAALAIAVVVGATVAVTRDGGDETADATTTTTATTAPTTTSTTRLVGEDGAPGVGDPYFPGLGNGGYDVERYDLALTWVADQGILQGRATIEATATTDLRRFNLDLAGLTVSAVSVDGRPATFEHLDRELQITPTGTIPRARPFTTVVTYSGAPVPVSDGTDLFEVGWQTDGREAYVVSEPAGAATFFPVNDHPVDKATYTFEVTAPEDQVVAANGLLAGSPVTGPGVRTWRYVAADPMASYLVQIVIGDYELVDAGTFGTVRIRHAFHRSIAAAARETTSRTAEMIDVLDDVYGPFPFEAYGVVAVGDDLGFALETQTLTIIGADIAGAGRGADEILVHELAHQWVGDAVSPATWKDIWLNEGFATYSEWLWAERTGHGSAADLARSYRSASAGLERPPGDPGSAELFSGTVYLRGAMTLQALREAIGDGPFFTVLRTWIAEHHDAAASTADLLALAERVSGQQLDDLFQRWLYEPGLPAFGPTP